MRCTSSVRIVCHQPRAGRTFTQPRSPAIGSFSKPVPLDSAAHFNRHARSSDIPLVDFWAAWCGPCKAMAPIFEQAACQLESEFELVKVDGNAVLELLQQCGIQNIRP